MPAKWSRPVFSFRFYEGKISRALIVTQHLGGQHTARRHRAYVGFCHKADIPTCPLFVRFSNRPSGSSTFRLSTTPVSMSPTGSRFSSDSAQGPCMGLFESSRVTHFFHRRVLGSISPGLILTASSTMMQSG